MLWESMKWTRKFILIGDDTIVCLDEVQSVRKGMTAEQSIVHFNNGEELAVGVSAKQIFEQIGA